MEMARRRFLIGGAAFGSFMGGRFFAAPIGWKPSGKPNLTFGVISDTHIRTMSTSGRIDSKWSAKYLAKALSYFRDENVDAVVHCGDFAHLGQLEEMQAHADVWKCVFPDNRAPDGHEVVKLFVTGNHEELGAIQGGGDGAFVRRLYPDQNEWRKHVLAIDMAEKWKHVWGEDFSAAWHKQVKGYNFFGMQWGVESKAIADLIDESIDGKRSEGVRRRSEKSRSKQPFFVLRHDYPDLALRRRMAAHPNAVGFFGHLHYSIANWQKIYFSGGMPWIQVPSCHSRGYPGLRDLDPLLSETKIEGAEEAGSIRARQGMVVKVYDDMMVVERLEFSEGGSLGPDWVMPFGKHAPHPLSRERLMEVIGKPEFRNGARLEICNCDDGQVLQRQDTETGKGDKESGMQRSAVRIRIPLADGNPNSRVYAYEVTVSGGGKSQKLVKTVYAAGCNMGVGHEPNGGVTTLEIPGPELPAGRNLTVSVRPKTSLGTAGRQISSRFKA